MGAISVPPAVSKVMVYLLIFHCAVTVIFSAGMVVGISVSQPIKVYPSLVGAAGAVIAVP